MKQTFYKIVNCDNNKVLANKAKKASNMVQRMQGLLGTKELKEGDGMIIPGMGSIHTFFMKYPLDLIFLDHNRKVVKLSQNVVPWRYVSAPLKSRLVLELPNGTIVQSSTVLGSKISLDTVQSG